MNFHLNRRHWTKEYQSNSCSPYPRIDTVLLRKDLAGKWLDTKNVTVVAHV